MWQFTLEIVADDEPTGDGYIGHALAARTKTGSDSDFVGERRLGKRVFTKGSFVDHVGIGNASKAEWLRGGRQAGVGHVVRVH